MSKKLERIIGGLCLVWLAALLLEWWGDRVAGVVLELVEPEQRRNGHLDHDPQEVQA